MTENSVLREKALNVLDGRWGLAIGTFLIYFVIIVAVPRVPPFFLGFIISIILGGAFTVGLNTFSLAIARRQEARLEMIFDGFKNFQTNTVAYLLVALFVFLWLLLLIIPGIIKGLAYSQTFFLLADDKTLTPMQAMEKSEQMMNGNKEKLFMLQLSFIGWALLCILTLGIGLLWLIPYIHISLANFYEDIREPQAKEDAPVTTEVIPQE